MNSKDLIAQNTKVPFVPDGPMAFYTTYRVGGPAEVLALPETLEHLKELLALALRYKIPFRVMGAGSNILVSDLGLKGITCCLRNFKGLSIKGNFVEAKSGTLLDEVVRASIKQGLQGLECLSGIPGSVGGAIFMNAGAFETDSFSSLKSFKILMDNGLVKTIRKEDVKYGYRKVEGLENCVVLSALWELKKDDITLLTAKRAQILKNRTQKQPLEFPSAGSVFKRPEGSYASKLIDECGLKETQIGGAKVSEKHAGFIINYDKATAQNIYTLIKKVQKVVKEKTGFSLALEQVLWGYFEDERI